MWKRQTFNPKTFYWSNHNNSFSTFSNVTSTCLFTSFSPMFTTKSSSESLSTGTLGIKYISALWMSSVSFPNLCWMSIDLFWTRPLNVCSLRVTKMLFIFSYWLMSSRILLAKWWYTMSVCSPLISVENIFWNTGSVDRVIAN